MNSLKENLTKLLLSAALMVMAITGAHAGEGDAPELSRQIRSQLSFPEELIRPNFEERVKVDFKVKADRSVEVIKVHTQNAELRAHVMRQFGKLNLDDLEIDTEQVYRIEVSYRVI